MQEDPVAGLRRIQRGTAINPNLTALVLADRPVVDRLVTGLPVAQAQDPRRREALRRALEGVDVPVRFICPRALLAAAHAAHAKQVGAAGLMVGLYYGQINFTMGWLYGLKAFTAAILGGIGNIPGAMVGGLLLGVIEAMGAAYISIAWKDAIAFCVLIIILIVRPTGLLGERVAEKI